MLGFHESGRRGPRHIRPVGEGAVVATVAEEDEGVDTGVCMEPAPVVRVVGIEGDGEDVVVEDLNEERMPVSALAGTSLDTFGW